LNQSVPLIKVVPKLAQPYAAESDETEADAEAGRPMVGRDAGEAAVLVTLNVAHLDFQRVTSLRHLTRSRQSPLELPACWVQGNCMNPEVAFARGPFHFWEAESRTRSRHLVPRGTNAPTDASEAAGTVAGMSTSSSLTGSSSNAAVGVARSVVSVAADTTDTAMRFKRCSASARPFNCSGEVIGV
jgi:hypothetical protein